MPEIPGLDAIRDFLSERLAGKRVDSAKALRPSIVRSYESEDFEADGAGRTFGLILRYGNDLTQTQFTEHLRPFTGGTKGILTRGKFIAGIGNACVDEVLFEAEVSPSSKRRALSADDVRQVYEATPKALTEAREVVREHMLPHINKKVRGFLKVHRKGGEPCFICANTIGEVTANQRITNYCRHCQLGSMIKGVAEHVATAS